MTVRWAPTAASVVATLLAATGLHGLFDNAAWYPGVVGAALVAGAAGALARAVALPALLTPLLSLLCFGEYAIVLDARRHAVLGVLPGLRAVADLHGVVSVALGEIRTFVVPVHTRPELVLIAAAGVWAVGTLTDLAAVRLGRAGLAGAPLLLLIAIPEGVHATPVGVWPFLAGAAGWLLLLAVENRARLHASTATHPESPGAPEPRGRPATVRPPGTATKSGAGAAASWRIGAAALGVAVVVPTFLPVARHNVLAGAGGGAGAGGSSSVTVVPPLVTVARQLHDRRTIDLLRVRTTRPEYLRMTTLSSFDGATFTLGRITAPAAQQVARGIAPAAGVHVATVPVRISVRVGPLAEHYLPLVYSPAAVKIAGDWRLDRPTRTVFSTHTDTRGASYTAVGAVPAPSPTDLAETGSAGSPDAPSTLAEDTSVPADEQDFLVPFADQIITAAHAQTAFGAVIAVQDFLRSPAFTYSLSGPALAGAQGLERFLTVERVGYCEQFATAMAALVRALGIPARVAVGFTPGSRQPDGSYVITNHDAHAWPEAWFPGTGWLRFEPTPATDAGTSSPAYTAPGYARGLGATAAPARAQTAPSGPTGSAAAAPALSPGLLHKQLIAAGGGSGPAAVRAANAGDRSLALSVTLLALALLLVAPAAARPWMRRRRLRTGGPQQIRARCEGLWAELLAAARDLGTPVPAGASPRATAAALAAALGAPPALGQAPPGMAALTRLVAAVELARYDTAPPALPAAGDVTEVRRALARRTSPSRRLRAVLVPPTAVSGLREPLVARIADGLDLVDRLAAGALAVLRRLTPRASAPRSPS